MVPRVGRRGPRPKWVQHLPRRVSHREKEAGTRQSSAWLPNVKTGETKVQLCDRLVVPVLWGETVQGTMNLLTAVNSLRDKLGFVRRIWIRPYTCETVNLV